MAAISSRVRSLRVLCFIVTLLSKCYKILEISKAFCDNIVTFLWGMSMQFFRFFVSNVRIRASVLLFSSINRLLFPALLQYCEVCTQQQQNRRPKNRTPVRYQAAMHARALQPFAQSSGMGSFQTFSLRQNRAIMTAICSRVALLCGSRRRPPGPGMPLISPRSHAQFMAVRA